MSYKKITIGSRDEYDFNDIVVFDHTVYSRHCSILRINDNYALRTPAKSSTFVNEKKVFDYEIDIFPGDVIRLGNTILPWDEILSAFDKAPEREI
jgi:pSer/pThr/pTyr-binding forkhead associated (FHA) protein